MFTSSGYQPVKKLCNNGLECVDFTKMPVKGSNVMHPDQMKVPFNIIKQQDEELVRDINRFTELYEKYKGNIDEVLEFANLCMRFYPIKKESMRIKLWKRFWKLPSCLEKRMLIG